MELDISRPLSHADRYCSGSGPNILPPVPFWATYLTTFPLTD